MSTPGDDLEPRRPSVGFLAAVVVVALIVLAGLVVAVSRLTDDGSSADSKSPTPSTSAASSVCGLPDGDQQVPTEAPSATWELTGTFATPRSKELGPGRTESGVPVCFAHSPSGAIVAAVSYLGATTDTDIRTEDLVRKRVLLDAAGKKLLADDDPADTDPVAFQLAGFRVSDASPDRLTVDLAVRTSEGPSAGQLYALTFTLTWSSGDWKLVVPATGQPPTSALSSLNGFVEWSGA